MTSPAKSRNTQSWKKIAVTGGILVGAAALATWGAFAVFTDSETANTAIDAGELDIVLTGEVTVSDIAPGDTVQRPITIALPTLTNDGDLVEAVDFFFTVTSDVEGGDGEDIALEAGESLVTGADGLDYTLLTCVGAPWVPTTGDVGPYSCAGTVEETSATQKLAAINGSTNSDTYTPVDFGVEPTDTGTFPSDTATVQLNSLIQFELPADADNAYENAATQLTFTASAVQRGGIQR